MLALGCSLPSSHMGISFTSLLRELEQIWTDIGETKAEKDRMLLELEKECLEIYQRRVDEAANTKARLHQSVAAKEAELATLMASLGELKINSLIPSEKKAASLKEKLATVSPLLEDLRADLDERKKQFSYVKEQLDKISEEISGLKILSSNLHSSVCHEEEDLSLHKLSEYQNRLRILQKEKADRVTKIREYVNEVHSLCAVLGKDFGKTVSDVHPSLHVNWLEQSTNTNLGNTVLEGLEQAILKLKLERTSRYAKFKQRVPGTVNWGTATVIGMFAGMLYGGSKEAAALLAVCFIILFYGITAWLSLEKHNLKEISKGWNSFSV